MNWGSRNIVKMVERITARLCRNFEEFDEFKVGENPNLMFGDGRCPEHSAIFNGELTCPVDCKSYVEVKA